MGKRNGPTDESHLHDEKEENFSDSNLLTPSEIESLRKDKQEVSRLARGRFKHLYENLK